MGQGALHLKKYRNDFRTVSKKRDFWCNDTLMIFFLINGGFFKTKCWKQQTPYDHCQYIHVWPGTGHHRSLAAPPYWSNSNTVMYYISFQLQLWVRCGQIEAVVVSERHALPTYLSCRFRMNEINLFCHFNTFSINQLYCVFQ